MKSINPREVLLVAVYSLVAAFILTRLIVRPTYTDSYYHYNAAVRLASGQGLTETTIWTYIGQPETAEPRTEVPSHLYWMPFTSMLAALGLWLAGAPGNFAAAQTPLLLCLTGTLGVSYWLGKKIGGERRHAVLALLLATFGGFFVNYWGEIDTFAPYALVGSLSLVLIGLGAERLDWRWFALAGVLAGFGHLTRSDGLLLLLVGWLVIIWPRWSATLRQRIVFFIPFTLGYLLVMTPWFVRMINAVGAPLPLGGLNGAWFAEYNDLFRSPPVFSAAEFFKDGLGLFLATRWEAFINNLSTFIVLEGFVVMTPLMLVGLWKRRGLFSLAFILFALGLHAAMTLVFPFPGYRGGLFHGVSALLPWWVAFGTAGLDDVVEWIARRRRHWKPAQARRVFSFGLVLLAAALTFTVLRPPRQNVTPALYAALAETLPPDARIMLNNPPELYYFTGLGGVVLPNEAPDRIPEIARQYGVTHLLFYDLKEDEDGQVIAASVPAPLWPLFEQTPDFLTPVPFPLTGTRLYTINIE